MTTRSESWAQASLAERRAVWLLICFLVIALVIPNVAGVAGAQLVKFSVPLFGFLATSYFVRTDKPAYALSCSLWLFFFSPLIRRLVDNQLGFNAANPVSLTPILGAFPFVPCGLAYMLDKAQPYRFRFAIIFVAVAYGTFLGVANGNALGSIFEGLRWLVPPTLCLYVLRNAKHRDELAAAFSKSFRTALPLLSAYGVLQFLIVPAWDRVWMLGADLNSIGRPEPFEIRIFSTLNSPGSFAFFLVVALLCSIVARNKWSAFGVVLGLVALALTLGRSAWIGLIVGICVYLTRAGTKERIFAVIMICAGVAFVLLSMQLEPVRQLLVERFASLSNIGQDGSVSDRLQNLTEGISSAGDLLLGRGFGSVNQPGQTIVIDGGLVVTQYDLGLFGGALYLGSLISCLVSGVVYSVSSTVSLDGMLLAITAIFALELLSSTAQAGEIGVFFWIPLGLALSRKISTAFARDAKRNAA